MGTRYNVPVKCTGCGHEDEAYYAPTCGIETWHCPKCGKTFEFDIKITLKEIEEGVVR